MILTRALAEKAAKAALDRAAELGIQISVSIVDSSGRLKLCNRDDGAGFFTTETSQAKAVASSAFRKDTIELLKLRENNEAFWSAVPSISAGKALPTPGGVIVKIDNEPICAIGCGGGSPDQDHQCAVAGAMAIQMTNKQEVLEEKPYPQY